MNTVGNEKEKGMSSQKLSLLLEETYSVVDDMFRVFENVKSMFNQWDRSKHMPFIREVRKLQDLESRLLQLGYGEDFTRLLVKCIYESVFTRSGGQKAPVIHAGDDSPLLPGFDKRRKPCWLRPKL